MRRKPLLVTVHECEDGQLEQLSAITIQPGPADIETGLQDYIVIGPGLNRVCKLSQHPYDCAVWWLVGQSLRAAGF